MPDPGAMLAGVELWRTSVYGSPAFRRRGARFLPELARTDLFVEHTDLADFIAECSTLSRDIDALALETGVVPDALRFRIGNLIRAAESAQTLGGLISIS